MSLAWHSVALNLLWVAMVVFIYQFDNFHPNKKQIYRIITQVREREENPSFASTPLNTGQLLKGNFTGVEKLVRIQQSLPKHVRYAEYDFPVKGYFADAEYLTMFNFPLLRGSPATSLEKPNTMVITEAAAARIFGEKDPMGEIVSIKPYGDVMITGIMKDMPKNTHLKAEALVSFPTLTSHHGASLQGYNPGYMNTDRLWNLTSTA